MFLNQKLRDNIVNSLVDQGHLSHDEIESVIDNAITESWEEMTLAERCGPGLWEFIHWMAAVSDNEDKPHLYEQALALVQEGHPCKDICRPHMRENLRQVDLRDYESAISHSHALHNLVNQQLSKDQYPLIDLEKKLDLGCDSCTFSPVGKSHASHQDAVKKTDQFNWQDNSYRVISPKPKTIQRTQKRYSAIEATIQYPSNFRTRDTSTTGVYQSRRSNAYTY